MSDLAMETKLSSQAKQADANAGSSHSANAGVVARMADFPEFTAQDVSAPAGSLNQLLDVAVAVTAELGRVTLSISDILKMGHGSIVGLERPVSDPIDLLVQGVPFARGEVVVIDDRFAFRITEIVDSKNADKK